MNAPLTQTAQAIKYIPLIDLCRSPTNPRRSFPAGLHAAADRAGIDVEAVRKQSAEPVDTPKPKKGKKKGAAE